MEFRPTQKGLQGPHIYSIYSYMDWSRYRRLWYNFCLADCHLRVGYDRYGHLPDYDNGEQLQYSNPFFPNKTNIIPKPPYTFNFIFLVTIAYFVHKGRLNSWVAALGIEALQILCYILLITVNDSVARYIFVMIATAASQSLFPIVWPGETSNP